MNRTPHQCHARALKISDEQKNKIMDFRLIFLGILMTQYMYVAYVEDFFFSFFKISIFKLQIDGQNKKDGNKKNRLCHRKTSGRL